MHLRYRSIAVLSTTAEKLRVASYEKRVALCRIVQAAVDAYLAPAAVLAVPVAPAPRRAARVTVKPATIAGVRHAR